MGSFLPPPKKTTTLQHIWKEMGRGEAGWISEAMQHLRSSVGLLMRAMLRMMELRGLTNFGKREQEEEESGGGGDLGPFVTACLIWEFGKKMAQRCRENERITVRVPHSSSSPSLFFLFFFNQTRGAGEFWCTPVSKQQIPPFPPPFFWLQIITGSSSILIVNC